MRSLSLHSEIVVGVGAMSSIFVGFAVVAGSTVFTVIRSSEVMGLTVALTFAIIVVRPAERIAESLHIASGGLPVTWSSAVISIVVAPGLRTLTLMTRPMLIVT